MKAKAAIKEFSEKKLLQMHLLMVKSRVLEERLIKIYRAGESYFWIGGPGEEAWGVPLGLLANKGQGLDHDWLHMHYRATPTLIAMGMETIDAVRLMMNRKTDPNTGGRNFSGHYCYPEWNVAPITSPIEVQYSIALGTARAQKTNNSKGITIVTGGDAGTAEGDFASSLVWSSRKGSELPMLITVQNNRWGISSSYEEQHCENDIADRARAFGMPSDVINGNDPLEVYLHLQEKMEYVRSEKKPAFIEAKLSRLYGHSSASGANRDESEVDPIRVFEKKLIKETLLTAEKISEIWSQFEDQCQKEQEQARGEPAPTADSIWEHVYADKQTPDWRKF